MYKKTLSVTDVSGIIQMSPKNVANSTLFYNLNTSCLLNSPSSFKEFVSEVEIDPNAPRIMGMTVTGCCHIFLISSLCTSASSPET